MNDMKRFNLLYDSWIPVKTRNGKTKPIKAFEIAQQDIVAVDAPRADFNAALMQFLVGLLQTVYAPENPRAWRNLYAQPPSENQLQERFKDIADAFYLDGNGYRFMQDALSVKVGDPRPVEELIFGAPGESGKEKNQDHFVKRDHITGLCRACAASALLTANIFAEDGGRGYFQSMRGNGFISCLVQIDECKSEQTLWKNLWLNVMENMIKSKMDLEECFYWLKDLPDKLYVARLERIESDLTNLRIRKKEAKDKALKHQIDEKLKLLERESNEVREEINDKEDKDNLSAKKTVLPINNSLHIYWAWMRRYFLDTDSTINGHCGICHNMDKLIVKFYKTGKGYKYPKEEWQNIHPFSPSAKYHRNQYTKENVKYKDKMLALEMTQNGMPYTYWQDFLTKTEERAPAKVVNEHLKRKRIDEQLILWSFGYAMDSNSPKGWYESKTPLYLLHSEIQRKDIEIEIDRYVRAVNRISDVREGYLSSAIRMAWFDYDYDDEQIKKKDKKPDPFYNKASKTLYNHPTEIAKSFWNNTEGMFYDLMQTLYGCINDGKLNDEKKAELRHDWYECIKKEAKTLFNRWAFRSGIQNNPKCIAKAYNQLMKNLDSKSFKEDILAIR
jgi:CRISPR system Cascade subunit CasA